MRLLLRPDPRSTVPTPKPAIAPRPDRRHAPALLLAACLTAAAAAQQQPITPDERLWRSIEHADPAPAAQPYEEHLRDRCAALRTRARQLREYLTLYPGGRHRDQAIQSELQTLFELGCLTGGDLAPLCDRAAEYAAHPPSRLAESEAAWWQIVCRQTAADAPASQPRFGELAAPPALWLDEYREFLARYPESFRAPRLASLLFDDALRREDQPTMQALVECLSRTHPGHPETERLAGTLRRRQAAGQPFALHFQSHTGQAVDTSEWLGQPILVVVWCAADPAARARAAQIEDLRRRTPGLRVVGVNLDESVERMASASAELGIDWPQWNDGLGRAHHFVRAWGLGARPWVLVIDRAGRLVGAAAADSWRELLARCTKD